MECTFSPSLVTKPKPITTVTADQSAFACLPFAAADSDGRGKEPVHERLYNMRGRTEVKHRRGRVG